MPSVVLLHAWWGRTPLFTTLGERLAAEGFAVAVPDLYGDGRTAASVEQAEALAGAQNAHELALQRYRAGLGSYLVVLNTETQWLAQRRAAVDLQARQLDTAVALMKALGGSY